MATVARTANTEHVRLAQQLPLRLLNFFRKYPPALTSSSRTISTPEATQPITIAENTSASDPNKAASTQTLINSPSDSGTYLSGTKFKAGRNPFLPIKNHRTGKWHGPTYSLRRQADLFKLAVKHNVLPLMPLSPKHPEVKDQKRIENGLRVQGTGIGKKVKGKMWERTLRGRLEDRRRAMEGMPEMIREWKERGHGRGWKKWPK